MYDLANFTAPFRGPHFEGIWQALRSG